MFVKLFKKIWEGISAVLDAQQAINTILGVAGMVALAWAIFWTWATHLETAQKILFAIATFCFFIVFLNLFISWWQKRNVERIPDYVEKIDKITWDYVDSFNHQLDADGWEQLMKEYGVLLGIDFHRFITAILAGKQTIVDEEGERISKAYERKLNPQNKLASGIGDLRDIGELLNSHNVGLKQLKESRDYQKLYTAIKSLQRKLPSVAISAKVNEYFYQSDGWYSLLLSTKPITQLPKGLIAIPIKITAKSGQLQPIIEGQIANLISAIRESFINYKERPSKKVESK